MKKVILFLTFAALALGSCSEKKTSADIHKQQDTIPMMIMQIQKCSKLYTAEYHIHKIITHDDIMKLKGSFLSHDFNINLPLGKRKIAIPMDATLKAYIDFGKFSKSNIKKSGNKIEIILPDPKVILTSSKIDHKNVKKFVAITRSNFSDEEMTNYEKQGRASIINSIPYLGIIELARDNAARILIPMCRQMGYKEQDITITFRKEFKINDLPGLLDKTTIGNENTQN
ncbi:MAG: DUF4230 domain-containing protein [Prevotella sp.]|nr:DUF4230 domain-containing protein [Prevotella sp.]